MAAFPRDRALSLLAAANNHGDLAVKISSLRQAKDILLSMEPSLAADLFSYLVELQSSPETLVRKLLIEVIEEIGLRAAEHSPALMSVLLAFLRDSDTIVVKQSIVSGTYIFCSVLAEMTVQYQQYGKVERWLEEIWMWMLKFKDAVVGISLEPGSVGTKLLALKFLETLVLLFSSDVSYPDKSLLEGGRKVFNISWLEVSHPVLDPVMLMSEANRTVGILLNLLQSAGSLPGCLTITVVNCLVAIARKRPQHCNTVLPALLDFDPNFQIVKGCHVASIQYSLRTAFLGFLRCTYLPILESRERLVKSLRAMNAGDAAEQVIRQVDRLIRNGDRSIRDARASKDDYLSTQTPVSGELSRKRSMPVDKEQLTNGHEVISKRINSGPGLHSPLPVQIIDSEQDVYSASELSSNVPVLDSELTAVEQMIAMIGALLAEGERGAESLEILISKIHPDLLADIVITNMRHLPKTPPSLTRLGDLPVTQADTQRSQLRAVSSAPINSVQSSAITAQAPFPSATAIATAASLSDTSNVNNLPADSKRDPRRDPRRLDPRRVAVNAAGTALSVVEDTGSLKLEFDESLSLSKPVSHSDVATVDNAPAPVAVNIECEDIISEGPPVSAPEKPITKMEIQETPRDIDRSPEENAFSDPLPSVADVTDEDLSAVKLSDNEANGTNSTIQEYDQFSPDATTASTSDDTCLELPQLPPYVELSRDHESNIKHMAVKHLMESYKHLHGTDCQQFCMLLLARMVAQIDDDKEFILMLQKHVLDDQWRKGHELVLHVLYHLHSCIILDSIPNSSSTAALYENFLLAVAKSLLEFLPASDKSFSRLLGEVPLLPESALKVLNDLCHSSVTDRHSKVVRDMERVTQGLGAIWSLILGRPQYRQACLDIALKCAVHPQDEIRTKAIRLVANKLYQLSYISDDVEQFAEQMLLSAVDQKALDTGLSESGPIEQGADTQLLAFYVSKIGSQETPAPLQVSESPASENEPSKIGKPVANVASVSLSEAQRLISLFFALCTKKPSLLQIIFDVYGRAPKTVKQAIHRHIPILLRALGQSYSKVLHIISNPPQGSENLLTLVLQILTQETTPSADLIATVKHLYETKLRDVSILVPLLPSLSKNEVLPIFPRLVDLPLEKFQMALAHVLQGSAHTGPALTPVEVLVAIHGIVPEKDGIALKKITDACTACFEQRTVFTQQVLAKALNQMVDQTPLPLLFMRTVIQAVDAFPLLVDFVMEILAKLVTKQVWRMPKLWVGFLKYSTCISAFWMQLPPSQLESALNKHANLRGPLASYASQPTVKSSLPRSILVVLGLANETQMQQHPSTSLHPSDTSSVHGATLT
ncbi:uncharacterized protein LOC129294336 isoform X2 [Prosopis cineraria]|uniref:uncharacterized protein LOC129294336 isoform X2 n=1 Tax=Prosopis cineraria TaxID=364024 RepID=UPI00240F2961|nr:uncharacterized protein LOC129294336 isoform X2 [Prosopis cineraria]